MTNLWTGNCGPMLHYYICVIESSLISQWTRTWVRWAGVCVGVWVCIKREVVTPPTPSPTPTFSKFVGILTKCDAKISLPGLLSVNLEYFIIKNQMQNFINIQYRIKQAFTGDDGFSGSYIRFVPTILIIMNI